MSILVTGGAGFIGSNFILDWFLQSDETVINVDKLTYAGNLNNLASLQNNAKHIFIKADINDTEVITELLNKYSPRAIINFAAESHVDRSIRNPESFLQTNVIGTFRLLECAKIFWLKLNQNEQKNFRFLHVSTDEVYGSLLKNEPAFSEKNAYAPNSPYSASKASSDHIVRSYFHTYGLPVLTTNCSNNYGPYQFPEKLIPLVIHNALQHKPLPIYGDGLQVRDWLYVSDHCSAIREVLTEGEPGEVYNIGGLNEKTNIDIVSTLCRILDDLVPIKSNSELSSYSELITYTKDRPGHDRRYAISAEKIEADIGWRPAETFETGIQKTVEWYLDHDDWVKNVINGEYQNWIDEQYS